MEKVAWIVDSTIGELEADFLNENHVFILPLQVIIDNKTYKEGVDITPNEFFEKIKKKDVSATTSQPTIGSTVALFESLKKQGFTKAIAIHLSSSLSGTFSTTVTSAEMANIELEAIDTKITSFPMKQLLLTGIDLLKRGHSVKEIAEKLRILTTTANAYLTVGNLEQLHKSGRLSSASMLMGTLLQIKPILTFEDGKVVPKEKIRTAKKAKKRMIELFSEAVEREKGKQLKVGVAHTASFDEANTLKEELQQQFPELSIELVELSVALGVHTGQGTIGIIWIAV